MNDTTITGPREGELLEAANLLLDARRTHNTRSDLDARIAPTSLAEVYLVQDRMAEAFGDIGGWKIAPPAPNAVPLFAPMPAAWMSATDATLEGPRWHYRGLEAEIAFLLGSDLPPRPTAYTREEVLAAVASCHPIIEVLETAWTDPMAVERNLMLADMQLHGGFVYGPAFGGWKASAWETEHVTLAVDGIVRVERAGTDTFGDIAAGQLTWLANEGAQRSGGLRAGQWVTTGSWTGNTPASSNSDVDVLFEHAGNVSLRFA